MYDANLDDTYEYKSTGPMTNEMAWSNLIAIANNPRIVEKMDMETQEALLSTLATYAKVSLYEIMEYNDKIRKSTRSNK